MSKDYDYRNLVGNHGNRECYRESRLDRNFQLERLVNAATFEASTNGNNDGKSQSMAIHS